MREVSTFDYFHTHNPTRLFEFWKRLKIRALLEEKLEDAESFCKAQRKKADISYGREWLKEESFLALFAFLKMLNLNEERRLAFFSEFLDGFYISDQARAKEIAVNAFVVMNNKIYRYLELGDEKNPVPAPPKNPFKERNPFGFGVFEGREVKQRVDIMVAGFNNSEKPDANFRYASDTLQSLMRQSVYHEEPGMRAGRILGYLAAGFFLFLAAAALAYLTVQTMGLIHLAWIVPVALLASIGSASAAVGIAACVSATPSLANRITHFFKNTKQAYNPIQGELFSENRPRGLLLA